MEDDDATADLEAKKLEIEKQIRQRQRAAAKARRDEEAQKLIAAGEGPRSAKEKAKRDAMWYEAEGKKRPRSPGEELPAERESMVQGRSKAKNVGQGKRQRRNGSDASDGHGQGQANLAKESSHPGQKKPRKKRSVDGTTARKPIKPAPPESEDSSELDDLSSNGEDLDDSEDDDDDDDDINGGGMTGNQISKVLEDEAPQDPAGLFDNDDGVEMASVRSGYSRRGSSSEVSRPPTSESEGMLEGLGEGDDDDDDEDEVPRKRRASKGKATKREAAFINERPTTLPPKTSSKPSKSSAPRISTVKIESDTEAAPEPAKSWPDHACLNPEGQLSVQSDPIRALCHGAIRIVEKTLVTKHAWPELHQAKAYKKLVLSAAVVPLLEKDKETYEPLQKRVAEDAKFVKITGKWVIDRLSNWRSKPRIAASNHIALYQLGVGDICKERVNALLENDVYVYPGEWGTSEKGKVIWLTKGSKTDIQVFLSPALIDTIKEAFFATPTGFGFKFKNEYVSSHPTLPEPELTIPLVALGATALYAAIFEWREGKKATRPSQTSKASMSEKFEGDQFKAVFDRHVTALTALKTRPNTYHTIMSTLFSKVTGDNGASNQGPKTQGNALAILDLAGLD